MVADHKTENNQSMTEEHLLIVLDRHAKDLAVRKACEQDRWSASSRRTA